MERVVILAARRYDFEDERKQRIEGITVTYLSGDQESEAAVKGCLPLSISAPPEVFHQLEAVPGVYDIDLRMRAGKGGRASISLVGVRFVDAVPHLLPVS